jgi:hypothetical protein
MQWTEVSRPVESQYVIATLDGGTRAVIMYFLGRATIESGVDYQEGPFAVGMVDSMDVPRQSRAFVRNLDRLDGRVEEFGACLITFD